MGVLCVCYFEGVCLCGVECLCGFCVLEEVVDVVSEEYGYWCV